MIICDFINNANSLSASEPSARLSKERRCVWLQRYSFKTIVLWLMLLCCLLAGSAKAQVTARIGYDSVSSCPPYKAQFADSSLGEPDTWYWDFGNGETSTAPKDTVAYRAPGYYTVKLRVQKGSFIDSTNVIVHVLGASAAFHYTYSNICSAPVAFNFIVDSAQNGANYHWSFGGGNISLEQDPTRTFQTGKYKISLQTISKEGCVDSASKAIQVGNVRAAFLAPDVVCANDITEFTNISGVDAISATWTANGTVFKTGPGNATYQFTSPGTYIVNLAEDFGSCKSEQSRTIVVYDKPTAQFSTTGILQSCTYPSTIQFKNESQSASAYKWYFGDGDSSTEVSPTHTYAVAGQFSPTLVAFNPNGCSDTLIRSGLVLLGPPVITSYTGIPASGCVPFDVQPVLNVAAPESIASYNWDFGDGTFSSEANPTHTYTHMGKYDITVTIKTVGGCTTIWKDSSAVNAGRVSTPDFTADKTVVCGNDPVQFTGTATGGVTTWSWNLADSIVKNENPLFRFKTPGYKTITVSATFHGCVTRVTKKDYVLVKPPFSAKSITYDCKNQLDVLFRDSSQQALTWLWDFGDGTSSTLQNPPLHSYSASGQYLVTLTTTNTGCSNTDTSYVAVSNESPVFTYDPPDGNLCPDGPVAIGVANPSFIQDYSWSFGDGTQLFSDTSVVYAYHNKGTYHPSLVVKYTNGCIDSAFSPKPIIVNAPVAGFGVANPHICARDTVSFTDNSNSDGVHEIVSRLWDFGDAQSGIIDTPPYTHSYDKGGTFTAKLTVIDNNHCTDTASQTVVVNELPPLSAGTDSFVCLGNIIQLQASGALGYAWEKNADLSCTNCAAPKAAPKQSATYYVSGSGTNGCRTEDSVFVRVVQPFTLALDNKSLNICMGASVQLQAGGTDFYNWTPDATLNNANVYNPLATPTESTTYTVNATDSFHCFNQTGSVNVLVHPNPVISIKNPLVEVEQASKIFITTIVDSGDIAKWYWYPSAGLSCTDCAQPVATAKGNITYTGVASTEFGCTDTATFTVHLLCNSSRIYIPTAFTPNGDGRNDRFYIQSSSNAPLSSLVIYSRTGNRVYIKQNGTTNNAADGWDGSANGMMMPAGVYIYMAEVICNGETIPLKGTITLLR